MSKKFHCLTNLSLQLAVPSQPQHLRRWIKAVKTESTFALPFVVASTTGCLGRRMAAQSTVDAMRAEQMELVDRYYRLESNYRKAERELERLRKIHGGGFGRRRTSESTDEQIPRFRRTTLKLLPKAVPPVPIRRCGMRIRG